MLTNIFLGYISATHYAKSWVKYHLNFYREYKKYIIHIIEPSSPEKDERESSEE